MNRPAMRIMSDTHEQNLNSASSVQRTVERYGCIEMETMVELIDLLSNHTDYGYHMELVVNVKALNKTIDNQHDALNTIENIKKKAIKDKLTTKPSA